MVANCPRLTIAGIGGDSGKTVISAGLCKVWQKKGLKVIPFKKGPDYIDMSWLRLAANHPCYNLDLFLMNREQVLFSFMVNTLHADIALIEGNRGLYDGIDAKGSVSTAELAKVLVSPVVLIVDCIKVTRTVAALILGCQRLDKDVEIKGVILNRIATPRQEEIIRKSIESYCRVPVVGAIPKLTDVTFPGRHLGLVPPQEHPMAEEAINTAAKTVEKFLDMEKLWQIAVQAPPLSDDSEQLLVDTHTSFAEPSDKYPVFCIQKNDQSPINKEQLTIGVIHDSAFQFYYPENIDYLKKAGAEIIEFSSLKNDLPISLDALYIGGGFPETHAHLLTRNEKLKSSIKKAALEGMPIYAECGGLMYLSERLLWKGKEYPLIGVFPALIGVNKKPVGHGYTILEVETPNPFFKIGQILRGHEFHYSHIIELKDRENIYLTFKMKKGEGIKNSMDGLCFKNVLATYTHLHALSSKEWVEGIINLAKVYKNIRVSEKSM